MRKNRIYSPPFPSLSCFLAVVVGVVGLLSVGNPSDGTAAPFAYIVNRGESTVSIIDTATDEVTSTVTLDGTLLGVTVNSTGTKAYFSRVYGSNITVLDIPSHTVSGTLYASGTIHGIAVSPDGTRLYAALRDTGSIEVLDAKTGSSITTIGSMSNPTGIVATPDGGRVYVANYDGIVTVVNALTNSVITTIGGLGNLSGIAENRAGTRVYTYGEPGVVSVIDTSTDSVVGTIGVGVSGGNFIGVAVSPDGKTIYAGGAGVSVIDTADNTVRTTIDTGLAAGIDMDPSGAKVYVTIPAANTVKVIDTATSTVTATLPVGSAPASFGKFIMPPPTCIAPPASLVSWWSGDRHPFDLIGANKATLTNSATYADGRVGRAFSFTGAEDSYVEIADHPTLNPPGAFTVDGWFYIDPGASGNAGEIGTLVSKSEGSLGNGWALYFDDRSNVGSSRSLKFVTGSIVELKDAILTPNWYHVAGVYDPSTTPRSKLYLNGVHVADSGVQAGGMGFNGLKVRIGAMYWTDTYHQGNDRLNGKADEVEFFSRALTSEEIDAIYTAGSAGQCKPCVVAPSELVSWWTGDNHVLDVVGGNNGTLMNGVTFASGMVDQAFSLDGIDGYVQIPNVVNNMPEGTIQGWIRYNAVQPGILFSATSGVPLTGHYDVMVLGVMTPFGATIVFGIYPGGNSRYLADSGVVPEPDQWYHVAGTWGPDGMKLYVDGALKGAHAYTGSSSPAEYNIIGASSWGYSLDGLIDEVQLFSRALPIEEIAAIHGAGSAGICIPPDATPDPFTFIDQSKAALNTLIESSSITVSGINTAAPISVTGGEYSVNGGSYTAVSGTVTNGQAITVRVMSSANWSMTIDAILTIGGVSDTFSVTTVARPEYTVAGSVPGGHGTIVCDSPVLYGESSTCYIAATAGYHLQGLTDNAADVTGSVVDHAYTIANVSSNHGMVAVFAINAYTIATSVPGDHGTISCASPANHGTNAVCTITPEAGYLLKSLTDNGTDVVGSVSVNTYTIVNVTVDHTVEGAFAKLLVNPGEGTIGTILEVKGTAFGSAKGKVALQNGGITYALKVIEWNAGGNGIIKAQLTKALVGGAFYDLVVYPKEPKGAPAVTESGAFEVKKPGVTGLSTYGGKIGATVKITGKLFGYKKGKVLLEDKVTRTRKSCKVLSWPATPEAGTGTGEVQFVVPKIPPATYRVIVQNKVGEDGYDSFAVLP
jgi:YVTN family beta-propeller protein